MPEEKSNPEPSLFDNLEGFAPVKLQSQIQEPESLSSSKMKKKKLSFGIQRIFVETDKTGECYIELKRKDFDCLDNGNKHIRGSFNDNSVYWEYTLQLSNDYLWIVATHGKTRPYNPKLTNVKDGTKRENTRDLNETEMNSYYFGLLHFQTHLLYQFPCNSAFFPKILQKYNICNKEKFYTRDLYISPCEFLQKLKFVNEISFVENGKMHNLKSDEKNFLDNLTDSTTPPVFKLTITAKYPANSINKFVKKLLKQYGDDYYSDIVIKGLDDQNAGMVLKKESFQKHIEIPSRMDANGLYSSEQITKIKQQLLGKINATQND